MEPHLTATECHLGALKMLDVKMTDVKLTEQFAGHEIAGHKIDRPMCRA